jgi:CDP-glucose 4,6-dehydratase
MRNFLCKYNKTDVFVTGHTGFKGSWLVQWLTQLGSNITGFSLPIEPNQKHYMNLKPNINSIEGNISDFEDLKSSIQKVKPEIVFHMAAQPIVRIGYQTPRQTFNDNIQGTVNLLESCRQCESVKAVIIVTSDKCYKINNINQGYVESDPMGGYDPYSASKACAEIVTEAYQSSFFNADSYGKNHNVLLASVRAGNVIGGGDWSVDRIMPDLIQSTQTGQSASIRFPKATRPWQHVLECLYGYLLLGEKLLGGDKSYVGPWNFGPSSNDACSVETIIKMAKEAWPNISYDINEGSEWYETSCLSLNYDKAKKKLNWNPYYTVEERVQETVSWYQYFYEDSKIITDDQINMFMSKVTSNLNYNKVSTNASK